MSSSIRFNKGSLFLLDGRTVQISRVVNGELAMLEDLVSLGLHQYSITQLLSMWTEGRITPCSQQKDTDQVQPTTKARVELTHYSELQIKRAMLRKKYLDGIRRLGMTVFTPTAFRPLIEKVAQELGDEAPPSPITVYRWFKREQRCGDQLGLMDRFDARGWFGCRSPAEVQDALLELIETRYLEPPGCSAYEVYDALRAKLDELNTLRNNEPNLQLPSYSTVRRAINSYPAYERAVARFGKQEASIRFRTSMKGPTAKYILEAAEIDHTPVDLFIVDENTKLPLGRPYLTILVDRKSRMILGLYVSFGGPSTDAVFQCLRNAILPKDYVKSRYPRVSGAWPCYGVPYILVCDNGLEFHSKALEQACFELGIILQFCPKKKPYFKGRVERAFRSIAHNFFHAQPGTSLANWMLRHGYDPLKEAVANFDEFMHALHIWVVDVYSTGYHRGLKRPPIAVWQEGVLDNPPALPDLHTMDTALLEYEERTLWHYGIELFNLRFNCRELYPIRHQLGESVRVQVRYNRSDLGYVYVIHPQTGESIRVPAIEFDYASGLRLEVHEMICRDLREAGQAETNPLQRAQAKERMREVIGESFSSKKLQERKRSARLSGMNSQDPSFVPMPRKTVTTTPPVPPVRITVTPKQFKTSFRPAGRGDKS
jgi:putative transposase